MSDTSRFTQQNRRAWNEIARVREQAHLRTGTFQPISFFAGGGSCLPDEVTETLGDVRGLSLLHLMCASGRESLSWANLGARVTAVDISDEAVALARANAAEAKLDVTFVASDVYALPPDLQQATFDVVYVAGGVLCWLPDIGEWARAVARALAPGGRLLLADEHPIAACIEAGAGTLRLEYDYFSRSETIDLDPGWSFFDDAGKATERKAEFQWPLGDIVTAVAQAGLRIESLTEYPPGPPARWRWGPALEQAGNLPGMFVLLATAG